MKASAALFLMAIAASVGCGGHAGTSSPTLPPDLYLVDGDTQSTPTGTAFPRPLVIQLKDQTGRVYPGHAASFVAPATGPSGTFTGGQITAWVITDSEGKAVAPTFTANGTGGSYQVQASCTLAGSQLVKFNLTNQ